MGMAGGLAACAGIATFPVLAVGGLTWGVCNYVRQNTIQNNYQAFVIHWQGQGYAGP
jgi:hypothetical protein